MVELTASIDDLQVHAGLVVAGVAEGGRVGRQGAGPLAVTDLHHRLRGVAHQTSYT